MKRLHAQFAGFFSRCDEGFPAAASFAMPSGARPAKQFFNPGES
jgi:hypothetical protein